MLSPQSTVKPRHHNERVTLYWQDIKNWENTVLLHSRQGLAVEELVDSQLVCTLRHELYRKVTARAILGEYDVGLPGTSAIEQTAIEAHPRLLNLEQDARDQVRQALRRDEHTGIPP